jgi:FixJ family two-component response regulator
LRSVIDRQISRLLFDVMINDLTCAVQGGAMESRTYADLSRELIAFKIELGRRTQVLIADHDTRASDQLEAELRTDSVSAIIAEERTEILSLVGRTDGPLAVVLALETARPIDLISELREKDPQIEILATAARGNLRVALEAVKSGAADYVLRASEGSAPISVRIKRLVRRARRHRLYMHLVATLYRAAKEANPNLADGLIFAAGSDPGYVVSTPITRPSVDIDEPFGSFESDYLEGSRIEGNPLGSRPLRRKK